MVGLESERRYTGVGCQLLNENIIETIKDAEHFLSDPVYWMQEKKNGVRCLIQKEFYEVTGIGKKGFTMPLPPALEQTMRNLKDTTGEMKPSTLLLDGELIDADYFAFDLIEYCGFDCRKERYSDRHALLTALLTGQEQGGLWLLPTFKTEDEKLRAFAKFMVQRPEGVVFKRHDAPYLPGRPEQGEGQRKFKF